MDSVFLMISILLASVIGFYTGRQKITKKLRDSENKITEKEVLLAQSNTRIEEIKITLEQEINLKNDALSELKKSEITLAQKLVEIDHHKIVLQSSKKKQKIYRNN